MNTTALGFIGGGRITKIFLQAFANEKAEFESIMVYDTNIEVLAELKQQFPFIVIAETVIEAAKQPTLFIALHPPIIMETLEKIAGSLSEKTLVISLSPKITIENIASKLKTDHIARMIPNATTYINEGYNPISFANSFNEKEKKQVLEMLNVFGLNFEVDEHKLEAYAILSAMLPTYFWFQWIELAKLGTQMGLSEVESQVTVHQTIIAAANLLFESELSPETAMDLIPVKPISEHQPLITEIYQSKLLDLFNKIKP